MMAQGRKHKTARTPSPRGAAPRRASATQTPHQNSSRLASDLGTQDIERVQGLPRADEHWLGGFCVFDLEGARGRVAAVIWMDRSTRQIRSCNLVDEAEAAEALVTELFTAMGTPLPGCAEAVPRHLSVLEPEVGIHLDRVLKPLDVRILEVAAEEITEALVDVAATLAFGDLASLQADGAPDDCLADFFQQAADFWCGGLMAKTPPHHLFAVSGLTPFPIMVSVSEEPSGAAIRIYVPHIDHVINDILEAKRDAVHVLFITYAREDEVERALFDEARRHGWQLPADDVVPVLRISDHAESLAPPASADFETAARVLEAVMLWDGVSTLDGRTSHTLRDGSKVQITWPLRVHA